MGQKWNPDCQSFKTNANMSAKAWFIVALAGGGADMDVTTDADSAPLGALTNDVGASNTDTKYLDVQIGGIIKVIAGNTITDGAFVMSDGSGEAIPVTTGKWALGQALHDADDGELVAVRYGVFYYEEG